MGIRKRILLVDDDSDLRQAIADDLVLHEDYETMQAGTGAEALTLLKTEKPDLIVLDVGLPDHDGRDVCRMIRKAGIRVPIIMLTGADTDADTILGLESGANDYVAKPVRFSVLLARLRAHLRQHEHSEDASFQIGPYRFTPSAKNLLTAEGRKVRLTEKETNILKYLYRAGDRPVPREVLLDEVWGYNAGVTTHTLETHVYRLRQKIEANPGEATLLVTEAGGYRLNARPS